MPSFAVELAGEANPLTEEQLIQTLSAAASSDPNQIQTGTKQLQHWEKTASYYKYLQSAYIDQRLPVEIRYLAVIQLKNGIDKYWRKTASNAVSKDDKNVIRSRLLESALNEPNERLALQNALVIAKVARFEYPNDWPDLPSSITGALRSQLSPLQLARALLVLLHIVKELSTGRLQRTRRNLQEATPEIVHVLRELYSSTVSSWYGAPNSDNATMSMPLSLMALKVLRRLLITGYEHPNRESEVVDFWRLTQDHLGGFIPLQKATEGPVTALIQKHMVQLAKLHHEMAREHPAAFAMLPNTLDLTRAYWNLVKEYGENFGSKVFSTSSLSSNAANGPSTDQQSQSIEKMSLKGLLIVRACVKMVHNPTQTFKYRSPEDKEEKNQATDILRHQLLTQAFVQEVMEVIVTKFFVFREEDLRDWEEEPEEWEKREEGDGEDWEFSIRSCSEKLFLDLAINYKDILVQPLLQVFHSVATLQNEDVLFKDSVYTAIGLAAPVIHEHLDFDAFIRDVLVVEVQKQSQGFALIRRRAAILLGQWISVKVSSQSHATVCEIFQHLLNKDDPLNDQVVRITAGRQFKNICDSWEFEAQQFLPYVSTVLTRLMQLVGEVELTETKMALLNTISVVVERLGHHISAYAERIVSMLPPLWEASGEEHLMKQAILTILARLVNAMKAQSLPIHSMVFPIIRGAVVPDSDTQVYLLDDAMELWASILIQTPEPASEELLSLVPYLYPIYELGSDNLRQALEITESYVLLAPNTMLSEAVRLPLLTALSNLLGSLKPDANGLVCNVVEVIIRAADRLGGESAVSQTAADLVKVGFMPSLLDALQGSWSAHCTTGPMRKDPPVDGVVETDYFSILARLVLGSTSAFCEACQHATPSNPTGSSLDAVMQWLLEEWFSHFENIGDPSRRKLNCLALTRLLETNQPWILIKLQSLMTSWTDLITELREEAEDISGVDGSSNGRNKTGPMSDSLVQADPGAPAFEGVERVPEAPEDVRRRHWTYSDVVHTVNLPIFVKEKLQMTVQACGGEEAFQRDWLVNVDRDVLDSFSKLGIMG